MSPGPPVIKPATHTGPDWVCWVAAYNDMHPRTWGPPPLCPATQNLDTPSFASNGPTSATFSMTLRGVCGSGAVNPTPGRSMVMSRRPHRFATGSSTWRYEARHPGVPCQNTRTGPDMSPPSTYETLRPFGSVATCVPVHQCWSAASEQTRCQAQRPHSWMKHDTSPHTWNVGAIALTSVVTMDLQHVCTKQQHDKAVTAAAQIQARV